MEQGDKRKHSEEKELSKLVRVTTEGEGLGN